MVYEKELTGQYVRLRAIREEDAAETLRMRLNGDKNRFLHKVDDDVERQRQWIAGQRQREGDYHFVVYSVPSAKKEEEPRMIGMMGIYEIEGKRGHIGRLLMEGNAMQSFEAYLLLFRFGFDVLRLEELYGDTDIENKAAYRFSQNFGFQYDAPVHDDEMNREVCYGRVYAGNFEAYGAKLDRMLYGKGGRNGSGDPS